MKLLENIFSSVWLLIQKSFDFENEMEEMINKLIVTLDAY